MTIRVPFLLVLCLCAGAAIAQTPRQIVDSLLIRIQEDLDAQQLAQMYGELGWQYAAINLDSAVYYGEKAVEKAQQIDDPKLLAQSYSDLGGGLLQKGELDRAREMYLKTLEIRQEIGDSLGMAKMYNNLGFIYQRKYESDSAIQFFLQALPIFEANQDLLNVASIKNNIGVIYQNMPDYEKAIQYYQEAVAIREAVGETKSLIGTYTNLGSCYKYLNQYELAEEYYQKAISTSIATGDRLNLVISYRSYAFFLQEKGDMKQLEDISRRGIQVAEEVNALYELATLQLNLGIALQAQGKSQEARPLLLRAASSFIEQGSDDDALVAYLEMIPLYASLGMPDSARYYSNRYQEFLRNKFQKESRERTAELETKYQTELKDSQIAEQELEIRNKNLMLFGSLGLALVLAIVGYLLYAQQKLKNTQLRQEAELKAALVQIDTQRKLDEQRTLIARDLHDNIGAQLTFIISSIENLKYFQPIQEQLSKKYDSITSFTKQTITELRDTIWAMNSGAVTWESLIQRVQGFLRQAKESSGIEIQLDVSSQLNQQGTLPSSESIQILRIIQEAVQNAVKYSNANHVEVLFANQLSKLSLQISDDGVGFDEQEIVPGHGLLNMKKRAEELGGELKIQSTPGKGTKVILLLN
ncbi:tetratricopeptide repeat-containing sensor histidine kinase [Algoriphagus vanfongensis]|uniref:tetratricopeptide repeat-containing sensor histidine kinase n=1 Tax=Algoriphagus vanfongensis TaxID=426371 RepID=UPI00047C9371|nr:tetratricopeptide repeat protein [Algoriphagus vanfongensis]